MTGCRRYHTFAALLVACGGARAPEPAPRADLIITNARIWTGDAAAPRAEALAIRGDRIG